MNRVLLTGGLGFIGSHTCFTLLENYYEVIVIDSLVNSSEETLKTITKHFNKSSGKSIKISFYKGDIRNYDFLNKIFLEAKEEKKPIDAVIHLAGLKSVGESVDSDAPLVELETDKVNVEVPSPLSGILEKINVLYRYICPIEFTNYSKHKFKLFIFYNEDKFKKKIRIHHI